MADNLDLANLYKIIKDNDYYKKLISETYHSTGIGNLVNRGITPSPMSSIDLDWTLDTEYRTASNVTSAKIPTKAKKHTFKLIRTDWVAAKKLSSVLLYLPDTDPQFVMAKWVRVMHEGELAWEAWVYADETLAEFSDVIDDPKGWVNPADIIKQHEFEAEVVEKRTDPDRSYIPHLADAVDNFYRDGAALSDPWHPDDVLERLKKFDEISRKHRGDWYTMIIERDLSRDMADYRPSPRPVDLRIDAEQVPCPVIGYNPFNNTKTVLLPNLTLQTIR